MIRLIAIYFAHDLPSAIVGHEVFGEFGITLFYLLARIIL